MVDFFLLLKLAGAGDELQGIKRGIIEMADAIAINKADGDNVERAQRAGVDFKRALQLYPPKENGWKPQVNLCSALEYRDGHHMGYGGNLFGWGPTKRIFGAKKKASKPGLASPDHRGTVETRFLRKQKNKIEIGTTYPASDGLRNIAI